MTKEERSAYYRRWIAAKRRNPAWLAKRRAKECARMKAYYKANPEKKRECWRKFTDRFGIARRPRARMAYAKKVVLSGRPYTPRFYMRKPDYAPVGASGIDTRSPYLWNNLTDEQRAYARELNIERKNQRDRRRSK